jgi:hypothetical protein
MKLELLTNSTVVDDAIRFVCQKSKEKLKSSTSDENRKKSNELDCDGEDQLEKEPEEETGEIITTNQIF